jgi:hypothetical protein
VGYPKLVLSPRVLAVAHNLFLVYGPTAGSRSTPVRGSYLGYMFQYGFGHDVGAV